MRSFFFLISGLTVFILHGQEPVKVNSRITDVTVFLSGAQVTRTASLSLDAGNSILLFDNLPANLNAQSIQAEGKGSFTILSVVHRMDYLQSPVKTKQIEMLQDSLLLLKDKLSEEMANLSSYQEQEEFIKANRQIGGNNTGVNIADLKNASDYVRSTLAETGKQKIRINRNIARLSEQITRITNQLGGLKSNNQPTGEILVAVSASGRTNATLRLSFLVSDAGWTPSYDLRAIDISNPVEMNYKAGVFQSTGENWDKVNLSLSTGNPYVGGSKPELQPWYLDFYQQVHALKGKMLSVRGVASKGEMPMAYAEDKVAEDEVSASSLAETITVTEAQTTTEYVIGIPADIPCDGQPHETEIKKVTLPASYTYFCAPKVDPDAFLLARISGWEDLNLLSGPMNIYFEGTYVGQSDLDAGTTRDTLEISLGRDKNINVKRERMKDLTGKQFIGGNRKDVRGFEITVRNRKKQDIQMIVEDQLPVSVNKEIEVEPTEISGADFNKSTGKLVWRFQLKPSDSKSLKMTYTVKYPKDREVILE